jgi:hypothetical protein
MSTSKSKNVAFVLRHSFVIRPSSFVLRHSSFVIRLPSRSLGEGWCFVIRLSSIVVSELPKTATGKVQKYLLRGQPAISKQ